MTWNRWSHSSICNKNDANNIFSGWYKIGFEIKNEIEGWGQSSPKFSGILRVLRCIIGPNLEILSWIGGEWWHGQAQNMAIFYFEVKFDLKVQDQLTPKTIGILTKVFCSSGSNLVILAWTGDKLSRGQASDYRTHRRTHRQTQATTIPEGQNWPRVKMAKYVVEWYNSIGLFNKQTYIVSVNPIVIFFCHKQYRICPLKHNLFGWFTYRGSLTATCWNNRNVRVESAAGKTVHKLFVGGVDTFSFFVWKI